jgi:hypothetical protein
MKSVLCLVAETEEENAGYVILSAVEKFGNLHESKSCLGLLTIFR